MQHPTRNDFAKRLNELAQAMELASPDPNRSGDLEDAAMIIQCCATLLVAYNNHRLSDLRAYCQRLSLSEKPMPLIVGDPCVYYTEPSQAPSYLS